jgi:nicotinate-nucleotide adenylyltransferase
MQKLERIGILGGSFDPVHNGHLAIARAALRHFDLQSVFFIPANIQPHKRDRHCASAADRLEMLHLALGALPQFVVWEWEIRRGGISYTVDTLAHLKELHPGARLYFIIGADNLVEIPSWHDWGRLVAMVTLAVAGRPGYSLQPPPALAQASIETFPSEPNPASSTEVRRRLLQNQSCLDLVPAPVCQYIDARQLYRPALSAPQEVR